MSHHHQNRNYKNNYQNNNQRRSRSRSNEHSSSKNKNRLHIGNLPLNITESEIERELRKYGTAKKYIQIIRNNSKGEPLQNTCFAFLNMSSSEETERVVHGFKNHTWQVSHRRVNESIERSKKPEQKNDQQEDASTLANLLTLSNDELQNLYQTQQQQSELLQQQILVRELWMGGLPAEINQKTLEKTMEVYGKIEKITLYQKQQNFAYVKYKKVKEASEAFMNQKNIQMLLNTTQLKIYFSDHQRRYDIVGDSDFYESDSDIKKILYIGYRTTTVPNMSESEMKRICTKYGDVKQILEKKGNQANNQKLYYLIEFEKLEDAKKAYKNLNEKKSKLEKEGRCEVAILLNPEKIYFQRPNNHQQTQQQQVNQQQQQYVNQPNQFIGMQQKPPFFQQSDLQQRQFQHQNPFQFKQNNLVPVQNNIPYRQPPMQFMDAQQRPQQFQIQQPRALNINSQNHSFMDQQRIKPTIPFQQLPQMVHQKPPQQMLQQHQQQQHLLQHQPHQQPQKQESQDILELLSEYLTKANTSKEEAPPKEEEIVEEQPDEDHWWSGFITRSKQHRLGIDMKLIRQNENLIFTEYHLNVTHRTYYEDAFKKEPAALVVISVSDRLNKDQFEEYVNYFKEKERAGVVQTQQYFVYILPKCEFVDKIYQIKENEMLGVFVDLNNKPPAKQQIPEDKKYDIYQIDAPKKQEDGDQPYSITIWNEKPKNDKQEDLQNLINNQELLDNLINSITDNNL